MKKDNEVWIAFDPSPVDVVSTKVRTWNNTHPGNMYYTDLVRKLVPSITSSAFNDVRMIAEKIVHNILDERGGRFLKPRDGDMDPTICIHMDRKQALGKVIHALRTAHSRIEKRNNSPGDGSASIPKKKKVSIGASSSSSKSQQQHSSGGAPRPGSRRSSFAGDSLAYKAKAGTQKIAKPILRCISAVCNQRAVETAHRVLDMPLGGQTLESEPNIERLMRLQLRHRFASAAAMGMSPLEFATKLLKLWDGKLVIVKRELVIVKRETKSKSPPAKSSPVASTFTTTPENKAAATLAFQTPVPQAAIGLPVNGGVGAAQNPLTPVVTGEQSVASVIVSPVLGGDNEPVSELAATRTSTASLETMTTTTPSTDQPMITTGTRTDQMPTITASTDQAMTTIGTDLMPTTTPSTDQLMTTDLMRTTSPGTNQLMTTADTDLMWTTSPNTDQPMTDVAKTGSSTIPLRS
jgi:hypothetical protein